MDKYLTKYKVWFESRELREKILLCVLSWVFIYALYSMFFLQAIESDSQLMAKQVKKYRDELKSWQLQLTNLEKIKETPQYKEWFAHNQSFTELKKKYKKVVGKPVAEQWKIITDAVLRNYPNIIVDEVKNSPETTFQDNNISSDQSKIYQQRMQIIVYGDFNNIVDYLQSLEDGLPNIYWNSMDYEVMEYPLAKVELEFSVLYEKHV